MQDNARGIDDWQQAGPRGCEHVIFSLLNQHRESRAGCALLDRQARLVQHLTDSDKRLCVPRLRREISGQRMQQTIRRRQTAQFLSYRQHFLHTDIERLRLRPQCKVSQRSVQLGRRLASPACSNKHAAGTTPTAFA